MTRFLAFAALAIMLAGCAIGNKYDLTPGYAPVAKTANNVTVAVIDLRGYVLNGDKTPTFIGLQRGGYGNPFDVNTKSGLPMAEDLTKMLVGSFERQGVQARSFPTAPGAQTQDIVASARQADAERILVLEVREWKTDVFAQVTVSWNLTARVFDANGTELASETSQGVQGTGSAGVGESGNEPIAQAAVNRRFGELLSRATIAQALQ